MKNIEYLKKRMKVELSDFEGSFKNFVALKIPKRVCK